MVTPAMENYKEYIANMFVGRTCRFTCDCIVRIDITGVVTGYEIVSNEIVYHVVRDGHKTKIGENTKGLSFQILA